MNDDAGPASIDAPDIVHWSPRHGATIGGPQLGRGLPLTAVAIAGAAVSIIVVAAMMVATRAMGRLAVDQADIKTLRIGRLEVGDLVILRGQPD